MVFNLTSKNDMFFLFSFKLIFLVVLLMLFTNFTTPLSFSLPFSLLSL